MGVAKLHFDVLTGLYVPSGDVITRAVRRAVSHPATVGFVKRAVDNGEGPDGYIEMPVWGMVLMSVSFYAAIVSMSLVCTAPAALPPETQARELLTMSF